MAPTEVSILTRDGSCRSLGVDHTVETWPARRAWVFRDTLTYDPQQSERHWGVLTGLLGQTIA